MVRIPSIRNVLIGEKDAHRISRRLGGLGVLLPRIKGPVLEAVYRKSRKDDNKEMLFRSFASASRPLKGAKQKGNRRSNACVGDGARIMTYCFKMT